MGATVWKAVAAPRGARGGGRRAQRAGPNRDAPRGRRLRRRGVGRGLGETRREPSGPSETRRELAWEAGLGSLVGSRARRGVDFQLRSLIAQ